MPTYSAPLGDIRFALGHVAGLEAVCGLPGFEESSPALVDSVLEEAAKFASAVLAPLNPVGDRIGSLLKDGIVRTPPGFREAYRQFSDGGWNGVSCRQELGGAGLPWMVGAAVSEIWQSANISFALLWMLTQGAIEALEGHASAEQKAIYLPKLVSGEWTGTMCLTEPQAGSDLALLRCKAVPDGEVFRIHGQKIFITYGEHDLTANIVHLVLARLPDAPAGTRGISLFIVPKMLADGRPNDLHCVSLEHKLGLHASPTAVMAFGDGEGAVGYLVGEANRGLEYMFTMMNNVRLNVGIQGVANAERAYQKARDYARSRVQGRLPGGAQAVTIIHHADIRRLLMTMKALTEAARGLAFYACARIDLARRLPSADGRRQAQERVDLLTPVVKAWSTDIGVEVSSMALQVHGGMGFIEETGIAQHYRDARIAPIYEGTNGIQALDLVGRKLLRDQGRAALDFFDEVGRLAGQLSAAPGEALRAIGGRLDTALTALHRATDWLLEGQEEPDLPGAAASPYLRLFGTVAGGWIMARSALAAVETGDAASSAKLVTARHYAEAVLSQSAGLAEAVMAGPAAVMGLDEEQF